MLDDSISRQAAIDTDGLDEEIRCEMCTNHMHTDRGCDGHCRYDEELYHRIIQILDRRIKQLPFTQPETHEKRTGTHACDCISRQDAIDALDNIKIPRNASWYPYYQQALTAMSRLPSAQPETDGFCTDCKEYDQKRNFCPRFDRVIKRTVEEMGIIHCKDCRHWDKTWTNDWAKDYHYCPVVDGVRKASFYCADAERRTDG